ncbi:MULTISPECIES: hypothetical protein [Vibrio]|uniref:hypothetical protein n=1 Tax=Vibrio TaxID=662 RepID=UPI0012FFD3FD|nr:hypothetical protein [Vibrio splendidus]
MTQDEIKVAVAAIVKLRPKPKRDVDREAALGKSRKRLEEYQFEQEIRALLKA